MDKGRIIIIINDLETTWGEEATNVYTDLLQKDFPAGTMRNLSQGSESASQN
jgi:hypothetical protein